MEYTEKYIYGVTHPGFYYETIWLNIGTSRKCLVKGSFIEFAENPSREYRSSCQVTDRSDVYTWN
jgi:hypothetical protein